MRKRLTFKECQEGHYALWSSLSRTGKSKEGWDGWDSTTPEGLEYPFRGYYKGLLVRNYCFACYACGRDCSRCPIDWGTTFRDYDVIPPCEKAGSPYAEWTRNHPCDIEGSRKKLAKVIRDLPFVKRGENESKG